MGFACSRASTDLAAAGQFRYPGMMSAPRTRPGRSFDGLQQFVLAPRRLFTLFRREARVYLLSIVASYSISFLEIAFLCLGVPGLGLIALNHWLRIPAPVIMVRNGLRIEKARGFATWSPVTLPG